MKQKIALATLLSLICNIACAGDLKKAFRLINTGRYEEAISHFADELKDMPDNVAANYGMAKVFSAKDFNRYNLDSAFIFAQRAFLKLPLKPDDKQTKKYLEFGVRDFTVQETYNLIQKEAFDAAVKKNTIESYNHFLTFYKDTALLAKATSLRNALAFDQAVKSNSHEALKTFIETYPTAKEIPQATLLYEKLLYQHITADGKPESYKRYMELYPKGMYFEEAKSEFEQKGLEKTLKENTLEAYVKFQNSYPNHPSIGRVQDSIYAFYTREGDAEVYKDFIRLYPNNRNIFRAWRELYLLETIHDTPEEYERFIQQYPNYPFMSEVQQDLERARINYKLFQRDDKFGYIDAATGTELIPVQFSEASDFSCGLAAVSKEDCDDQCSFFYINKKGDTAFAATFNYAGDFVEGRAVVGFGNCSEDSCKYGVIDKRGKFIVQPVYDELDDISEGFYAAARGDKYGFLDRFGRVAIPFQFEDALGFKEGVAAVKTGGMWTFIDTNGIRLTPKAFKKTSSFSSALCAVTENDSTWGYINHQFEWVIAPMYAEAGDFEKGFAVTATRERDKAKKNIFVYQRYKIDSSGRIIEKLVAAPPPKTIKKKRK
ncbi:MAG: WG repeat-containing protein [Chitinophagales bacterium]|nr:WG repeat-containing protein [Chitinophagales bacterium]